MSRTSGWMSGRTRIVAGGGSAAKAASPRRSGTLGKPSDAAPATVWRNRLRVVFMEGIPAAPPVVRDSGPPMLVNDRWLECTRNRATFNTKGHGDTGCTEVGTG